MIQIGIGKIISSKKLDGEKSKSPKMEEDHEDVDENVGKFWLVEEKA